MRIAMIGCRGIPATYGGIEKAVEAVSVRLAARGHDVTVYCRPHYCRSREPSFEGVALRYLPSINTKHLEAASHTLLAALDASARRYDVVHFHGTGPALFSPICRAAGERVVATVQGLDYRRGKWGGVASRVLRLGAWMSAKAPTRTVVVSRTLQGHFARQYKRATTYIPNGFDELDALEAGTTVPSEPYILFLGRLVPEKGVHYLVEAYKRADLTAQLIVAGPSSHSDNYVRELHRLAAGNSSIHFTGPVYGSDKAALIRGATLFCQPSDLEGLPLALMEAMAAGTCAIVSDIPEHLEIVRRSNGDVAFLFDAGNVDDLAGVLRLALADPAELTRKGRSGSESVRADYCWDGIVDELERVYASVIASS
jgi:glycosyltransferase involved in cell wall biosynthesis